MIELRCSSLDRLIGCPGSFALVRRIEEDSLDVGGERGHALTWAGNWCHWEAARRLIEEHAAVSEGPLAPPVLPAGWKPGKWDYVAVDWFLDALLGVTPPDHAFHVEHSFAMTFPWRDETVRLTGHVDVLSLSPDGAEAHWNDQKRGIGEVDAADINWQLGGYGALIKHRFPSVKRGTARIFQRSAESPVSEVSIDDMDRIVPFMQAKICAALDDALRLETGKHCIYCPAIFICPALRKEIEAMQYLLAPGEADRISTVRDLAELGVEAHRLRLINTVGEKVIESFRDRLQREANGQLELPTKFVARVVEEPGRRVITNAKAAFDLLTTKLPEEAVWETVSVSASDIEDQLVAAGMKRTSKKGESASGWVHESMKHLIQRDTVKKLKFVAA